MAHRSLCGGGGARLGVIGDAQPRRLDHRNIIGAVTDRERMALPAGATATVEIRDISRADAPAPLLASTTITPTGNQVPLHWIMTFDPAKVAPQASYSVSARINDKAGKLMWVSDTIEPALTRGAPLDFVDVDLVRAK